MAYQHPGIGLRRAEAGHCEESLRRWASRSTGERSGKRKPRMDAKPIAGTRLVREWQGTVQTVTVLADGYEWQGRPYQSLSAVARAITGTRWNGWTFFGLRRTSSGRRHERVVASKTRHETYGAAPLGAAGGPQAALRRLHPQEQRRGPRAGVQQRWMPSARPARPTSSANAPKAGCWCLTAMMTAGISGGTLERPALRRLLADIEAGRVDVVVVYKIDRLSRALMDFRQARRGVRPPCR